MPALAVETKIEPLFVLLLDMECLDPDVLSFSVVDDYCCFFSLELVGWCSFYFGFTCYTVDVCP